jgi:hypothetical protein
MKRAPIDIAMNVIMWAVIVLLPIAGCAGWIG